MEYYTMLDFECEPFSNSPDPDFFYYSKTHGPCLQRLELAVRLKRGLNVVVGDVGMGKTTLCRRLYKNLSKDASMDVHFITDPSECDGEHFISVLHKMLGGDGVLSSSEAKEELRNLLYEKAVVSGKTVVLLLDEAQKLPRNVLESLRELLNYETNEHKLIQIVLFAQMEILDILKQQENLADRINEMIRLEPLGRKDVARLIEFRLHHAQGNQYEGRGPRYTKAAVRRIHRAAKGRPRRIIHLCHAATLAMIIREKSEVTGGLIRSIAEQKGYDSSAGSLHNHNRILQGAAVSAFTMLLIATMLLSEQMGFLPWPLEQAQQHAALEEQAPSADMELVESPVSNPQGEIPLGTMQGSGSLPEKNPKLIIGEIISTPHEYIWNMAERVYGRCNNRVIREIRDANPHIKDLDRIPAGSRVHFPLGGKTAVSSDKILRSVGIFNSLEDAYIALSKLEKSMPVGLTLVVHPDGSLIHHVVSRDEGELLNYDASHRMYIVRPL
jgi:general secretion pathway protein A